MPLRILIVEDEKMIALDLQDVLEEAGHQVVGHATNMADALAIVSVHKPHLAVIDIELDGEGNGLDVAQSLGADHGIPALFLTGRPDFLVRAMALDVEPLGYVSKPYRRGDILAALTNFQ